MILVEPAHGFGGSRNRAGSNGASGRDAATGEGIVDSATPSLAAHVCVLFGLLGPERHSDGSDSSIRSAPGDAAMRCRRECEWGSLVSRRGWDCGKQVSRDGRPTLSAPTIAAPLPYPYGTPRGAR